MFFPANRKIAILGTSGVPANYGGFETLTENLVRYHDAHSIKCPLTVYCSSKTHPSKKETYLSSKLKYISLSANGMQSILYDIISIISAVWSRADVILLLGVSGAIILPLIRLMSCVCIVTNIDGIEWRRSKWRGFSRFFLHLSEKIAIRFSHQVIADNTAIAIYIKKTYGVDALVIEYGGDHALIGESFFFNQVEFPGDYIFSVCRIEPENNIHLILEAFSKLETHSLVIVGNWMNSKYGYGLKEAYSAKKNVFLLDPIYESDRLKSLRSNAYGFVHGHSAGGTNPSLVEAMHFGKPILAFDCDFNRYTTENKALYFKNPDDLVFSVKSMSDVGAKKIGDAMLEIARRRYIWNLVSKQYFDLLRNPLVNPTFRRS